MLKVLEYNSTATGYEVLVGGPELGRAIAVYVTLTDGHLPVCTCDEEDNDLADDAIATSMCFLEAQGLVVEDPELEMIDEDINNLDLIYKVWVISNDTYERLIGENKDSDAALKLYTNTIKSIDKDIKESKLSSKITSIKVQLTTDVCYNGDESVDVVAEHIINI